MYASEVLLLVLYNVAAQYSTSSSTSEAYTLFQRDTLTYIKRLTILRGHRDTCYYKKSRKLFVLEKAYEFFDHDGCR